MRRAVKSVKPLGEHYRKSTTGTFKYSGLFIYNIVKIATSKFTFSSQAKKLPEILEIDERFAYVFGLWTADKCSTAKGIVGIRSKDRGLLQFTEEFFRNIGLQPKWRTITTGYSQTQEVYVCSMPLRRIFEWIQANLVKIFRKCEKICCFGVFRRTYRW